MSRQRKSVFHNRLGKEALCGVQVSNVEGVVLRKFETKLKTLCTKRLSESSRCVNGFAVTLSDK